ncbi:MAG TPA: hypothetical protein VK665_08885, partial [Candidatus Elarobacter sp.]|nr:hypothetical protein [Candidatus Elarobacter sp.]
MSRLRSRVRRSGVAFVLMGLVLSTVDVNPAGEIPGAYAEVPAAVATSPQPSASPSPVASAPAAASASPAAIASPAASASAPAVATAPVAANAAGTAESAAVAAPAKGPEGGDLTHLTFTATGPLSASLVEPADDAVATSTAASVEVQTVQGAGVELKVGDAVVPFSRIGKRTVDTKTGVTRYVYYGVALQPGPNAVALTPLGANGVRGETTMHRVFGPGRPASIAVSASGPFRADGTSADQVRVEARDAWGHRAAAGSVVQILLVQGDAKLERVASASAAAASAASVASPVPLATSSPGAAGTTASLQRVDVALDADGAGVVRLIPGLTPGAVVLRAECGDVTGETRLFLAPNLRKPFVTGLVSAGAGAVPGIPGEADGEPNGAAS